MPKKFRVLIVDDDPFILDVLNRAAQTSFSEALFTQVASVGEAKSFFHSLEGYEPRLLLVDINLAHAESGFDFLNYFRADQRNNRLPVIMLTVSQAASDIRQAYQRGATSFSVKPSSYGGWQTYLNGLRSYWLETVTLPVAEYVKN